MYDSLCTGVITWTSTVAIASAFGRPEGEPRMPMRELGRILLLPPNWALAAGLLVNLSRAWATCPRPSSARWRSWRAATLPLTMLYAGLMIDFRGLRRPVARRSAT